MATCPRCGGPVEGFELAGHEASVCPDCGYIGVPVDHGSDREDPESWGTALERFYERHVDPPADRERGGDLPEIPTEAAEEKQDSATGRAPADAGHSESTRRRRRRVRRRRVKRR